MRMRKKAIQDFETDGKPWRDFRKGVRRPSLDSKRIVPASVCTWTVMRVTVAQIAIWRLVGSTHHRQ